MTTFELTDEQEKKYEEWRESLPYLDEGHFGAAGGGYSFVFTPTGLGMLVKATRADNDAHEIDLTEWEHFG